MDGERADEGVSQITVVQKLARGTEERAAGVTESKSLSLKW